MDRELHAVGGRAGSEIRGHAVFEVGTGSIPGRRINGSIVGAGIGLEDPCQPDGIAFIDIYGTGQLDRLPALVSVDRDLLYCYHLSKS